MKGDHMGILAADPTQRELPLSNWARFRSAIPAGAVTRPRLGSCDVDGVRAYQLYSHAVQGTDCDAHLGANPRRDHLHGRPPQVAEPKQNRCHGRMWL